MTKKHFVAIADILRKQDTSDPAVRAVAADLAAYFKQENPRFDAELFLTVAGF